MISHQFSSYHKYWSNIYLELDHELFLRLDKIFFFGYKAVSEKSKRDFVLGPKLKIVINFFFIISVYFLDVKYISLPHKKRFFKFDEYKP